MRERDLREIGLRLEEVEEIFAHGYDPIYAFGEPLWEKCHAGRLHTHEGALRDIEEDRRRPRRRRSR